MISELRNNRNTPLAYIGVQGSPTCSIYWGKHKINKYKTESMNEDPDEGPKDLKETSYGVMTEVLDEMLKEIGIDIPFFRSSSKRKFRVR